MKGCWVRIVSRGFELDMFKMFQDDT